MPDMSSLHHDSLLLLGGVGGRSGQLPATITTPDGWYAHRRTVGMREEETRKWERRGCVKDGDIGDI